VLSIARPPLVKVASGLGYAPCAMPPMALAAGLKTAIASSAALLATGGRLRETARRFSAFYLANRPGIAIGVPLLAVLDKRLLASGLGLITLAYVALALALLAANARAPAPSDDAQRNRRSSLAHISPPRAAAAASCCAAAGSRPPVWAC